MEFGREIVLFFQNLLNSFCVNFKLMKQYFLSILQIMRIMKAVDNISDVITTSA